MADKKHEKSFSRSEESVKLKSKEKKSPTIKEMDRTERAEVEKLRSEIARDRIEAQATIEALKERLAPGTLKDQAQERIREVTIGKAQDMAHSAKYRAKNVGYSVYDSIKENIAPTAMIGLGFAWLVKRIKGEGEYEEYYPRHPYVREPYAEDEYLYSHDPYSEERYMGGRFRQFPRTSGGVRGYYAEEAEEMESPEVSGRTGEAREKVSGMAEQAKEKASGMTAEAREKARRAGEKTSEMMGHARERFEEMGHRVRGGSRRVGYKSRQMVEESPLFMAGILFAVGAALGFLIPRTRTENEWMGETRDEILEQAKHQGRETMERAKEVVRESGKAAAETAKQEAKKQGLTSDETERKKEDETGSGKEFTRTEDLWSPEGVKTFKEP